MGQDGTLPAGGGVITEGAWAAVLAGTTLLLFLLPLVPGLLELYRREDAAPLRVIAEHERDIRRFARGFRVYVQDQLRAVPRPATGPPLMEGRFSDGTRYLLVRHPDAARQAPIVGKRVPERTVVVVTTPFSLPPGFVSLTEVYAIDALDGYGGEVFRGLLGEGDVWLGAESMVLRWIHAEGNLRIGPRSRLYGRASAEGTLRLNPATRFERVYAPTVEIGRVAEEPAPAAAPLPELPLPEGATLRGRRCVVHGDLEVLPGHLVPWDLVVRGHLHVRDGARLAGAVKSTGDLRLDRGVVAEASLISGRSLAVGRGCRIAGPVIAEDDLVLATRTRVGAVDRLTTVTAPQIWVETGVAVHGALLPRLAGWVGPFG